MVTPITNPTSQTGTLPLLSFKVAEQTYSLPVTQVVRIIEMVTLTHLPAGPDILEGMINLHGKPVAVVDLRTRFNLPQLPYGLYTPIILVEINEMRQLIGVIVDVVDEVLHLPPEAIATKENFVPDEFSDELNQEATWFTGMANVDGQMIIMLDAWTLLSRRERRQLSQALDRDI